jgi:nitrogen fixation protein
MLKVVEPEVPYGPVSIYIDNSAVTSTVYIPTTDLCLCLVMAVSPSAIDGYCSLGKVRLVPIWRLTLPSCPPIT